MALNNIFKAKDDLSQSEKKIQKYIEQNPNRIEMLTINKLAANAGTSVASAQRYCRKLGFSGYKEFKFAFLNNISQKDVYHNSRNNLDDISKAYLSDYQEILTQMSSLNRKEINHLISCLTNEGTNYCLGVYYSGIPTRLLGLELQDLGTKTFIADDYTKGEHILANADPNSTIVVFSITGTKTHYDEFWGEAIKQCNNSFLITMNEQAELNDYFKNKIVLPGKQFSQKLPFDPQSIPALFVELITQAVYKTKLNK